jgi:hypothetical protein
VNRFDAAVTKNTKEELVVLVRLVLHFLDGCKEHLRGVLSVELVDEIPFRPASIYVSCGGARKKT